MFALLAAGSAMLWWNLSTTTDGAHMLKPSHFTTPRQLADCTFVVGFQEHPFVDRAERTGIWLIAAGIALGLMFIIALAFR